MINQDHSQEGLIEQHKLIIIKEEEHAWFFIRTKLIKSLEGLEPPQIDQSNGT